MKLLPEIVGAGIASLKIEGRMKRPEYTAGVVSIYRKYLDRLEQMGGKPKHWKADPEDLRTLMDLSHNRGGAFTEGYYHQHNGLKMMSMERPESFRDRGGPADFTEKGGVQAQALEYLYPGDVLESHDTSFGMTVKRRDKDRRASCTSEKQHSPKWK
ncbi:MAG: peptidase U32 family protein [Lachnospiraceae bacterium]